jgi:hypothetical protein
LPKETESLAKGIVGLPDKEQCVQDGIIVKPVDVAPADPAMLRHCLDKGKPKL